MELIWSTLTDVVNAAVLMKAMLDRLPSEVVAVGTVASFLLNLVDGVRRTVLLFAGIWLAIVNLFCGPRT